MFFSPNITVSNFGTPKSHSRKVIGCQWTTTFPHLRSLPLQLHSETERGLLQPGSKTIQKLSCQVGQVWLRIFESLVRLSSFHPFNYS